MNLSCFVTTSNGLYCSHIEPICVATTSIAAGQTTPCMTLTGKAGLFCLFTAWNEPVEILASLVGFSCSFLLKLDDGN